MPETSNSPTAAAGGLCKQRGECADEEAAQQQQATLLQIVHSIYRAVRARAALLCLPSSLMAGRLGSVASDTRLDERGWRRGEGRLRRNYVDIDVCLPPLPPSHFRPDSSV